MDIGFMEINTIVDGLLILSALISVVVCPPLTAKLIALKKAKDGLLDVIDMSSAPNETFLKIAEERGEKGAEKEIKKRLITKG